MQITYDTKIKDILEDDNKLKKAINIEIAKKIRRREDEISSFKNFLDYILHGVGKPHSLEDSKGKKNEGYYGVSLTANMRLIIKPNCEKNDAESLKECEEVTIIGVRDYHGKNEEWIMP